MRWGPLWCSGTDWCSLYPSYAEEYLLSDLATLHWDAQAGGNSAQPLEGTPFSAADSVSGVSSISNMVPDRPLALNSSTYTSPRHNAIPTNKINDIQGTMMFSMSHRILPRSPGNFWYLQVGFDYLEDQDSIYFLMPSTVSHCIRWTLPLPSLPRPTKNLGSGSLVLPPLLSNTS